MNIFKTSRQLTIVSDGSESTEVFRVDEFDTRDSEFSNTYVKYTTIQLVNFNFTNVFNNITNRNNRLILSYGLPEKEYAIEIQPGLYNQKTLTEKLTEAIYLSEDLPYPLENIKCVYDSTTQKINFHYVTPTDQLLQSRIWFVNTPLLFLLGFDPAVNHSIYDLSGEIDLYSEHVPDLAHPKKLYILLNPELNMNKYSKYNVDYFAEIPMAVSPGDYVSFTPIIECEQIIPSSFSDTSITTTIVNEDFEPVYNIQKFPYSLTIQLNSYTNILAFPASGADSLAAWIERMQLQISLSNSINKKRKLPDGSI